MTETDTHEQVAQAQTAALRLANVDAAERDAALADIADAIRDNSEAILAANEEDVAEAEQMLEEGEYTQALVDRLKLDESKLESIAGMVESVADQSDPLGKTLAARELDADLELYKQSVPIGVVGTIFESRPDALVQIAALALKSGNAVILKVHCISGIRYLNLLHHGANNRLNVLIIDLHTLQSINFLDLID